MSFVAKPANEQTKARWRRVFQIACEGHVEHDGDIKVEGFFEGAAWIAIKCSCGRSQVLTRRRWVRLMLETMPS